MDPGRLSQWLCLQPWIYFTVSLRTLHDTDNAENHPLAGLNTGLLGREGPEVLFRALSLKQFLKQELSWERLTNSASGKKRRAGFLMPFALILICVRSPSSQSCSSRWRSFSCHLYSVMKCETFLFSHDQLHRQHEITLAPQAGHKHQCGGNLSKCLIFKRLKLLSTQS